MEVIVSHDITDFDALAAMVACRKLHPQAVMVSGTKQCPGVRRFLNEHKELLPLYRAEQLGGGEISILYIVGAPSRSYLGEMSWLLDKADKVVAYNHHAPQQKSSSSEQAGAATTFLAEKIRGEGQSIVPFEASLFLLGIYAHTHCLTSVATTSRDAQAVAWLLEQGGKVSQIGNYIDVPLAPAQGGLLGALLGGSQLKIINERSVLIMTASTQDFISGLGLITRRLAELEDCDLVVGLVQMGSQMHLVGHSFQPDLNLLEVFSSLSVKGQAGIIAATFKGIAPSALYTQVEALLERRLPPRQVAGDIMSAPVKTVPENASIYTAHRLLLRYGHGGIPVVGPLGTMTGIITRGDIEKALRHKLGQVPVRNYMTRNVLTLDVLTPMGHVLRTFIQNDIGRLPVLSRGELVGIITRTDLLGGLFGKTGDRRGQSLYSTGDYRLPEPVTNLAGLIKDRLPQRIQGVLMILGQIAQQEGFMVYAVGGFVRDLLLGLPTTDLDVAVESDAIRFADQASGVLGGRLLTHGDMGTAVLTLADGFKIDFSTARMEYYQYPGAKPQVEQTTIRHDLHRRDFTINALAFTLNSRGFGDFLDFFGGLEDLRAGKIRVLYNLSFVEDPTRIIRAIRFAGRYGFRLEKETRDLLDSAVADGMLTKAGNRLGKELRQVFLEENAPTLLKLAQALGVLPQLFPGLEWSQDLEEKLFRVARVEKWQRRESVVCQSWLLYPLLLLTDSNGMEQDLDRFGLGIKEQRVLRQTAACLETLARSLAEATSNEGVYDLLRPEPVLVSLALLVVYPQEVALHAKVFLFLEKLAALEIAIDGKDLMEMGVEPGPEMGRILKAIHRLSLEGKELTREQELDLAERLHREGE